MRRISAAAGVCVVAVVLMVGTATPASYASEPNWGFEALYSSFPAPSAPESLMVATITTPVHMSPLLAKETAVLTSQGISPARAGQAINVQSEVAQRDIVSKVEAAMGSSFGGAWFDPAAAQMHVGVTTLASRRAAEQAIAHAGLEGHVTATPVRSTMLELARAQKQWNMRLANLFERGEVSTGLEPQGNAVAVTLGSSVPTAERAALRREALNSSVNVTVNVASSPKLIFIPLANNVSKCKKGPKTFFVPREAWCDPPIAAGVRIESKTATMTDGCTAGPAAIPTAKKNETVILTAGHCIDKEENGSGETGSWDATTTAAETATIGKVQKYSFGAKNFETRIGETPYCGGLCNGGDFGDILINAAGFGSIWRLNKGPIPVYAQTAEWKRMNKNAEETAYPVTGEKPAAANSNSCHVGEMSGESCGVVKGVNRVVQGITATGKTYQLEGLVEVTGKGLEGMKGDSGGPFMAINATDEKPGNAEMEGTLAGKINECVKNTTSKKGEQYFKTDEECEDSEEGGSEGEYELTEQKLFFTPLKRPMVGVGPEGSLEALGLELLTTKNQERPPKVYKCVDVGSGEGEWEEAKCGKEEAKGAFEKEELGETEKVGLTLSSGETIFETEDGGGIKCTKTEGAGEISGPTEIAKLKPVYKGCEEIYTKTKCKSGTGEGEVVANPLRGTPVYLDAALTKVGLLVEAEGGGALAKFKCGVYEWEITDSFICPITPENTITATYALTCNIGTKEGFRRQEWRDVEEKTPLHEIWLWLRHGEEDAGAPSAVGTTATVTSGEAVEIRGGYSSPTVTSGSPAGIGEKEATLQGTVNPEGTETKYYFEYGTTESYGSKTAEASAGSGTSSVEVSKTITGLTANTKYHYRLVATNGNETTYGTDQTFTTTYWSAQEPPTPKGATASYLEGVSCTSSTECMAAGWVTNSSGTVPLAEKWGGTAWSAQEPPAPTGAKGSSLHGVSCTSSTACVAVGEFMNSSATWMPLAEKWNGTTWSAEEPPLPTGASFAYLNGVSCTSSTACVAVGEFWNSSDRFVPWAEKWNGMAWSAQELPLPTGVEEGFLYGVSCTSSTACAAVGEFEGSGEIVPLAEKWNGTAWSAQKPPVPAGAMESELSGVSCASSTECVAVGEFENGSAKRVPLAEKWNGTAWSAQEPPPPTGAQSSHLYGVSCTSSTACTADGRFENSSGKFLTLVERWNGTAWSAQEPPAPRGAKGSYLYGVSCLLSTECTAVGYFENSSSTFVPLAERYSN
jgi:hypothetical protein